MRKEKPGRPKMKGWDIQSSKYAEYFGVIKRKSARSRLNIVFFNKMQAS